MVWVLAAGLALLALGLGIKVALLRHGMKALRRDLVERRGQDTNTLLSLPCRDRELRRLASALNQELRALRQERPRPAHAFDGHLRVLAAAARPGPAP